MKNILSHVFNNSTSLMLFLLFSFNMSAQDIKGNYVATSTYEKEPDGWYSTIYMQPIKLSLSSNGKTLKISNYDFLFDLSGFKTGIGDNKNSAELKNLKSLKFVETVKEQKTQHNVYTANLSFADDSFLKVKYAVMIVNGEITGLVVQNLKSNKKFLLKLKRV